MVYIGAWQDIGARLCGPADCLRRILQQEEDQDAQVDDTYVTRVDRGKTHEEIPQFDWPFLKVFFIILCIYKTHLDQK